MNRATVDRGSDLHTHSNLTDGTDTPEQMADAAVRAGLHTWGLSDHVRADSNWVTDYAERVAGLRRSGLRIRCGVEAKMLDSSGRLDLPVRLPNLDYVLIADHQFPSPSGPLTPDQVREALIESVYDPQTVIDGLIRATVAAVRRAPFRPIVVHPFSLLPKVGLSESDITDGQLAELATGCRAAGASVEINEKWRCPSQRTVTYLLAAQVPLVVGSDAHRAADIGSFSYVDSLDLAIHPGANNA